MATTNTPRLQLLKPTPNTGEKVIVQTDLNDNWDKIDAAYVGPSKLAAAPVKRNTADAVTSGTDSVFETWTGILKTGRWYETNFDCQFNTSLAVNTTPNGTISIRLKAGGTVINTDPQIAKGIAPNQSNTSPRFHMTHTFDVPADGTYTLGITANSGGGTNTLNILASGGSDNTGNTRCFFVKDLGEK